MMWWDLVGSLLGIVEGIEKLAGNAKGDRLEEDWRTCRKIVGGCWSMGKLRVVNLVSLVSSSVRVCLKKEDSEVDVGR
ncbi:hypothetical protein B296_00054038 [Ensete ventricosum]|uniref:Uncharacterized protein n=1 Tax=Ensete ventricosum TaxID=4639 RepID=A0A426WW92_ENSVE|nr:hypothetical protein B296_00054038 [Ensete ventricosum]